MAHSGADVPWHALGCPGGIVQSMEVAEFGSYGDAHTRADIGRGKKARRMRFESVADDLGRVPQRTPEKKTGGELVLKHAGDLDFVEREWLTPADELTLIYAKTGRTAVTPEAITQCMRLGFLGIWANRVRGHFPDCVLAHTLPSDLTLLLAAVCGRSR